jgi:hypothetical protein
MDLEPDPQFVVPGGQLLYHRHRDARFQYFYLVNGHPLVRPGAVGPQRVIVYVQDTSKDTMRTQLKYEQSLQIPLGPDSLMEELGMLISLLELYCDIHCTFIRPF